MKTSLTKYTSPFICKGLRVRGSWRPNINCNILTPTLMAVNVVSFSFSWCSTRGPEAHSAGWWLSLLHLISIFSGPQFNRGPWAPLAWCGFPYHISSITPSDLQLQLIRGPKAPSAWCGFTYHISSFSVSNSNWNCNCQTSVLTELYNSLIPTQSPTRFLESHVGSSSSGNNCHAVHRLLSSGASVYECTMGIFFTSSHFISQFLPTRFPLITAIRMCHFLSVHHSEWHFWLGRRSKCHIFLNDYLYLNINK